MMAWKEICRHLSVVKLIENPVLSVIFWGFLQCESQVWCFVPSRVELLSDRDREARLCLCLHQPKGLCTGHSQERRGKVNCKHHSKSKRKKSICKIGLSQCSEVWKGELTHCLFSHKKKKHTETSEDLSWRRIFCVCQNLYLYIYILHTYMHTLVYIHT